MIGEWLNANTITGIVSQIVIQILCPPDALAASATLSNDKVLRTSKLQCGTMYSENATSTAMNGNTSILMTLTMYFSPNATIAMTPPTKISASNQRGGAPTPKSSVRNLLTLLVIETP